MTRGPAFLLSLLIAAACVPASGVPIDAPRLEEDFVGGWDGSETRGVSILLIREGLSGRLNAARLSDGTADYRLDYDVGGEISEDGISLALTCADAKTRKLPAPDDDDGEPSPWVSIDCAEWELALECSLARSCRRDCNMVCDVINFGDAYGRTGVSLASIEDEFDYWKRV